MLFDCKKDFHLVKVLCDKTLWDCCSRIEPQYFSMLNANNGKKAITEDYMEVGVRVT